MLIDTHCHLDFDKFDKDREEVITRAKGAGVKKMINIGCSITSSEESIKLAENYNEIYATIGIHPEEIKTRTKCGDSLAEWMRRREVDLRKMLTGEGGGNRKIVAIGEIGVDYHWMTASRETQLDVFKMQIKLAREFDLPVILHCREAQACLSGSQGMACPYEDAFQVLVQLNIKKAVFHCFAGNLEFARKVWEVGYFTSFTGIITYPKSENLREIVREVPMDKIMIETDSPFLAPQKFRGQRNEPAFVKEVAAEIARIKGMDIDEVATISTNNAEIFFGI